MILFLVAFMSGFIGLRFIIALVCTFLIDRGV